MRRDIFNALADPTRRGILLSLLQEPQNVNALAEKFEMTRQAVSLHIKYLQECDAIIIEKNGRERNCHINAPRIQEAAEWLEPFRKMWMEKFQKLDTLLTELQEATENTSIHKTSKDDT